MSVRLQQLSPEARRLLVPELASGEIDRWPDRAVTPFLSEHPSSIDLRELDAAFDRAIAEFAPFDPSIDPELAVALHRALPLRRRDAAEPGLWRFLSVVHRPDVIRHRWENRTWTTMRRRFWNPGTRPDSHAFARLWWIAELTRRDQDFDATRRMLRRPALANNYFTRQMSAYPPLLEAYLDVLEDAPPSTLEAALRALTRRLSTLVLESLSTDDLRSLLSTVRLRVETDSVDR